MQIVFKGEVLGVVKGEFINKETKVVTYKSTIGLQYMEQGKYGLEPVITDVKISDDQIAQGLDTHYRSLVGSTIEVEGQVREWSYNGKIGISKTLPGDGLPTVLDRSFSGIDSDIPAHIISKSKSKLPASVQKAS